MRKERKIISSILIISILLSIFMPIFSNAYTIDEGVVISLDSDATELVAGNKITVTMRCNLASEKNIDTFSGTLKYDNTILEFDTDNEFITSTETKWNSPDYVDNNGSIQIETSRSKANTAKSGLMFTMVFNVLKTIDSTEISLEEPINCAYMGVDIWCDGYTLKIPNTPETYRITYNSNTTDNVDNMPSIGTKVEGIDYTIATTPIRTGYTFKEWNTSSDGTGTSYAAGSTYSTDANLELFAQWEAIKTTLTVNPNGGVWNGSSANQTFEQNYGSTKEIDDPTTTPNGYTVRFNANGGTTDTLQSTQTTTFENWTLTGGGRLDGTTYTFKYTTATLKANYKGNTITLPDATKTGATFKGWYTASNGGTKAGVAGDAYTPEANTTLFAQWDEIQYTLTINPNGGTYNGQTTVNGGYNSTVAVTNPTAPNGYTVTLEKNDGTGTTTQAIQTMTFDKWVATGKGNLSGITYTFGDGDGTLTATYKSNNVELETPIRTGYTFDGWYTLANGGTKIESPYMPTNDVTLYAHWTANKYQVTFNPGEDGTVTETTRDVTYGQPYGTLPTPTRPGYTFKGWVDSNGNPVTGNDIVNITSDTTLTATWQGETYTLTINPNGGTYNGQTTNSSIQGEYKQQKTISDPVAPSGYTITLDNEGTQKQIIQTKTFNSWTIVSGDGTINETTYTFGTQNGEIKATYTSNSVELEKPTREGYTFDGWYTLANGGTKIDSPYMPTNDVTLYAHWTANKYQVTFNPGEDGTVTETTREVTYGQPYGTLPTPTRNGFEFVGWYNPEGNEIKSSDIVNITSDTTLTAKWLGAELTITFDPDGGELDTPSKKVRNKGTYGELPTPTKPGYTFKGWYDPNENKIESTSTVDLTEDTTLVAKWEENKYTVTFDPGENGTVTEKTREVTYGKPYGELPTPTRPGYTFDGWYDPDGNKIQDTDIADILKDTTFTAKWIGEKHTLIFDYDGGNGNIQNKIIKNGEQYGELPNATKEGHTFIGWFDEDDNQVTKETIANTTTDITVHAKYEKEIYTITFKNDDGTILSQTTVKYGEDAEYKGETPIKTNVTAGYKATFTGWDNQNLLKNVTENREVKATYTITPIEYTIKYYNLKDSDNSANPTTYTINTPNITLVNLPNQEKYIFKGWYTSNDDKGVKVTSIDTSKLGNIILYAQWENDNLYYKSEKYKVGENNIDIYEDGDIYLDKIEPQTTVKKLVENSDTNGTITVIDENGNKLKEDDLVGTGMTIKVTRYDEEITMTAVVMGDLDGNGLVTATDLSTLNQVILKTTTIEGAVFKAADLDDNEKLTATDLSTINNTILKNITLTYDKKQSNITSMTML